MTNFKNYLFPKHYLLFLTILLAIFLRFLWLDKFPPSLYTDEADQGYNAYSILKTAKDEHGNFLPVSLRSFGDWKPALPTYLMTPFVYMFGLNEISVRLPSTILGVMTILVTFLLVYKLFKHEKHAFKIALLTSFFLTISPWHILQSRAAMLVMIALFFLEIGIYFLIKSIEYPKWLVLASLSFGLSIYTYYSLRIITPLIVIVLLIVYRRKLLFFDKYFAVSVILGIFLLMPLASAFWQESDVLFGRARTVSIFYDQGVKLRQWELITQDGISYPSFLSRFFHNNWYMFGINAIERFLSHFEGNYLFMQGDTSQPFQIPNSGIFYLTDFIFLLIGLYCITRYKSKVLIISLFIISFIPAAFTFMTPTSNRTFNAIIPFMIFNSIGLVCLFRLLPAKYISAFLITTIYVLSFSWFLKQYFLILPKDHADFWNYGWKEVVEYADYVSDKYDNVIVADVNGMPYIYFLFYGLYNPLNYQKEAIRTYVVDRFGFEHVEGFGKYLFPNNLEWKYVKESPQKSTLYVVPADQAVGDRSFTKEIKFPSGKTVYKIFEYE